MNHRDQPPRLDEQARIPTAARVQPPGGGWLHWYAGLLTLGVLVLICSGGMVTSKNAGLAVPDWPNTYGYNIFLFPVSRWVGGVLFEHVHRLIASAVGLLTIGLAVWLWVAEPRRWVRVLGVAALIAVIVQGVLGGLRVVELKAEFGIFHACLAQAYLALCALITLVTSRWWIRRPSVSASPSVASVASLSGLSRALLLSTLLIYVQLALGATMRHAHAGLAIPDFPTAYGEAWPHVDAVRLAQINQQRDTVLHLPPTSIMQIQLQMGHRMMAGFILLAVLTVAVSTWRQRARLPVSLRRAGVTGLFLIACQIGLGITTIWTNKAADVATAHVAVGALSLVWGVLTYAALRRWMMVMVTPAAPVADSFEDFAATRPPAAVQVEAGAVS